jgi:hypothetical protein
VTNRSKFIVFRDIDDPEIQVCLDNGENVVIVLGKEHFEMKSRHNSLGIFLSLHDFGRDDCIYGKHLSRDCEDIETFLKLAKQYLGL